MNVGLFGKKQAINKGVPSAVLLSIAIHAALFLLAGTLVVFTVVKKKEIEFEPPKTVERPKMKLKKPKPRIKKSARPKKAQHILTKVKPANMPEIQLPELSSMGGDGLGEGIVGGFDTLPDLGEPTLFGSSQSIGNDFVGTFYDLKRDQTGRGIPYGMESFAAQVRKFIKSGWNTSKLARFYHSPQKLYAICFMVPPVVSQLAPEAFNEPDASGYLWMVHYKGQLVCPASHTNGITFRFRGVGDNILVVRVDGRVVLSGCAGGWGMGEIINQEVWSGVSVDSMKYYMGTELARVGDWITLEPGASKKMEVLIGEMPGGAFSAMLAVEEEGVEYPKGPQGNPLLPMFKTAEPTLDQIETIYADLVPGEVCITNGPVFCDYDTSGAGIALGEKEPVKPPVFADDIGEVVRTWSLADGKTVEAEFVTLIGDKVVLKDLRGRMRKVPSGQFSEDDLEYIELARPPRFNIDFVKKSEQKIYESSPFGGAPPPRHINYVFGTRLKQTSAGKYNHELNVEFFAIGEEIDGDNYILLDRQESRFTPSRENGRSHEFFGGKVALREKTFSGVGSLYGQRRGDKYGGYLVVVTDGYGYIIEAVSPYKWMLDIISELRRLPVGKHFDKTGTRRGPPRPKPTGQY